MKYVHLPTTFAIAITINSSAVQVFHFFPCIVSEDHCGRGTLVIIQFWLTALSYMGFIKLCQIQNVATCTNSNHYLNKAGGSVCNNFKDIAIQC